MAKTCLMVKQQRPAKFKVRAYHRCKQCGRRRAYLRKFGLCRVCFRKYSSWGLVPGVLKASW